jgi:RimJ/RimL family protein N-acetyltransferase
LHKALELKLFEDQKDTIKLSSLVSNVIDNETQDKIDVVKQPADQALRLQRDSATDVLNYVASIFARGDVNEHALADLIAGRKPEELIEVGWRFLPAAWGKGYATETGQALVRLGIEEHGLPRIIAMAMIANTASCRAIGKCGLSPAGDYVVLGQPARLFEITRTQYEAAS